MRVQRGKSKQRPPVGSGTMRAVTKRTTSVRSISLGEGQTVLYPVASSPGVSCVMRGNRKRDTAPELRVRRLLHERGARYRVNPLIQVGPVRVRPDVVFPRLRVALFIDGCFWHGCPVHGTRPRSNSAYWESKIANNRTRDQVVTNALAIDGWRVFRVWEHEPIDEVVDRVMAAIRARRRLLGRA